MLEEIDIRPQSDAALRIKGGRTRSLTWTRIALENGLHVLQLQPRTSGVREQLITALQHPEEPALIDLMSDEQVQLIAPDPTKLWFFFPQAETERMQAAVEALDRSIDAPLLPPGTWCDDCGSEDATLRDPGREEPQLLCDSCFQRWKSALDTLKEHQRDEETAPGVAYPPLEPSPSLTSEKLWEISQTYEELQRQSPERYWFWIRAWVWLGQLVLIGAALGTVLAVISMIGIVIAALTISPWFALLLLKGKAIKLFLALAVGAFFLGWRAVQSVFSMVVTLRPKARELGGTPIERERLPRFSAWIDGIAAEMGAPRVDEIRLMPGLNAFASEVRAGAFGHRKVLGIGLDLMELLDERELRAVVAHELGHLHHGDTRTLWVYRTVQDWLAAAWTWSSDDGNLLASFARWYIPSFLVRARALARQHELRADGFSVQATDPETAARALLKIHTIALIEEPLLTRELPREHPSYRSLGHLLAGALPKEPALTGIGTERALRQPPHWMDTHPPLARRLEAIGARPTAFEPAFEPALTLLDDAEHWMHELAGDQAVFYAFLSETARAKQQRNARYVEWLTEHPRREESATQELRADLLADLGDLDAALGVIDAGLATEDSHDLRFRRAALLHNAFRYPEACEQYERLATDDTHLVRLLNEGAVATFLYAGRLDDAVDLVKRCIAGVESGSIGEDSDLAPLKDQLHRLELERVMAA